MGKKETPNTTKAALSVTRQGASIIPQGGYPGKLDSVAAEALARLLAGERLQSLDSVQQSSTTRLAAHIHYLESKYHWQIDRRDRAAGCTDGRVTWVAEYYLHPDVIAAAAADGAREWVSDVMAARRLRRAKAAEARRKADGLNSAANAHGRKRAACEWGAY